MAQRGLEVAGVALAVAAAMCALCSAQTPTNPTAAAIMPTCAPVPISLLPCIGYVFGIGTATLSSCCSQLQAFFQSQGPCICAMSRLAPSPFGLLIGQAQCMIPNVCNLPSNPCDDVDGASKSPAASTPAAAGAVAPAALLDPTATTAPETTPAATPVAPTTATTPTGVAPPVPADDSPAAVAAAPGQAGSSTGSQAASKLPQLLHASGARSSRDKAAGTVLVALVLAYVLTMHDVAIITYIVCC